MFGIIFFTKKTCLYPSQFSRYSTRFDICTAKFALFLSLPSKRSVWWCRNLSHWWFGYIWLETGALNNVWKAVASHAMAGNYNQVSWMSEGSNAGVFIEPAGQKLRQTQAWVTIASWFCLLLFHLLMSYSKYSSTCCKYSSCQMSIVIKIPNYFSSLIFWK